MDYESFDRAAVRYVVTAVDRNQLRFFLTTEGLCTDIMARAQKYRHPEDAAASACGENTVVADRWPEDFHWHVGRTVLGGPVVDLPLDGTIVTERPLAAER